MQFSAAIAVPTSCDKYHLVFGNFSFASASYSYDDADTVTYQEQLILLNLLNKSISTYCALTSFTQKPTHVQRRRH